MSAVDSNGKLVVLKPERWRHIVLRHPELRAASELILDTIAHPDEVYVDPTGAFHALKRVSGVLIFS
jgi:hypothetical protein